MDVVAILSSEFNISKEYVKNTVELLKDNTIPFIARYRKEVTGSMTDVTLRELSERLDYLNKLDERREDILRLIDEQGKLTEELAEKINTAMVLGELEDLYRPYKPKKETRASIARAKGLEPMSLMLRLGMTDTAAFEKELCAFINEETGYEDIQSVLGGVKDIVAEDLSDDADVRKSIKQYLLKTAMLSARKSDDEADSVYENYFEYDEAVGKVANHRVLALNRGEKAKSLKVSLNCDVDAIVDMLFAQTVADRHMQKEIMREAIEDSIKRLILPSLEREIRSELTERASTEAIKVFSLNLKPLLLSPPIRGKRVLAIDPGIRTGSKLAVVDETGKVLGYLVLMLTVGKGKNENEVRKLATVIEKYHVDIIAIGNGTASRETELLVADMIRDYNLSCEYIIVSEAGASIYSASPIAVEEFPKLDVTIRGAISIARRLQDPLAELVKIEPRHIGVGQYQHDIDQKKLDEALTGVVEDCVNSVGVDLNTASSSLLSYVAGINKKCAGEIIKFREENGKYESRAQLKKVKGLGPKTFTQCAGFLRISDAKNPLDYTAVHPESYDIAEKLLNIDLDSVDINALSEQLGVGVPTLSDIISELKRPGRDPRDELPKPILRSDVLSIDDLSEGMVLKGTVRNVVDFGAFIDIGIKDDGLVHISEMSDSFIKHPKDVASVGDIVEVRIISIDKNKKRVSLSMRGIGKGNVNVSGN